MALCDGTRFAVFDLTRERWDDPEYDHPNADLPQHFNELFALLGAPCIAETIRRRQLGHLRRALEAQVDLRALDRTHTDVLEMIDAVRPIVLERREDHRRAGREHMAAESRSVLDAAGMWGHAQRLNRPHFIGHWGELERAVEFVRRQPPSHRIREFDDIERATIPRGAEQTRMWFPLRALRLGTAVLLSEEEGCGDYCREVARVAARQHAAGFADDPLLAASYRLQRLLGPLGWRLAARTKRSIDHDAAALAASLEAEEWLRLDGALGITSPDNFKRFAQLASARILRQVDPWTIDQVTERADEADALLDRLGTPDGFEELLSATDPWLPSWLTGDPLAELSITVLKRVRDRYSDGPIGVLADELLGDTT